MVIVEFMHMKCFSTKPISFERAINIKLKNIKILNGNPILKKFGGYPPKKLESKTTIFFTYLTIFQPNNANAYD